jgi:hypothetical protein
MRFLGTEVLLLAALAAGSSAHGASPQDSTPMDSTQTKPTTDAVASKAAPAAKSVAGGKFATASKSASARPRYKPDRFAGRAGTYYKMVWGVDSLGVKTVESGELIRFTYRVLDADKAKTLNDQKIEPSLIDPRARVSLVVPSLEKVGKLRQSEAPEEGKSYWMAFSNKGRLVKRGDYVNVVIGEFHADGLVVD